MGVGKMKRGKVGLQFCETMSGFLAQGESDFHEPMSFQATIRIRDVEDFCKLSGRRAELEGTVSYKPLGQNLPMRNGQFVLFRPEAKTGNRQMTYEFGFTGNDGQDYFFYGYKVIYDDPRRIDIFEDMTRLFSRLYKGLVVDWVLMTMLLVAEVREAPCPRPLTAHLADRGWG